MGCTSSVPNTSKTNAISTDKSIQFEEEHVNSRSSSEINHKENNHGNEIKVLPSCDNLVEPIHVVRSNKSLVDLGPSPVLDNVCLPHVNTTSENKKDEHEEDKISTMEEVVEKVIELHESDKVKEHVHNTIIACEDVASSKDQEEYEDVTRENKIETTKVEDKPLEETTSPSQSESSRATRWEALADIAAELPASLTIDPLTGQIYALSK